MTVIVDSNPYLPTETVGYAPLKTRQAYKF